MNTNINTSLQGQYTFYDENMNVLCETKNLITDWGMRRLVGDRSIGAPHPADTDGSQQAFVNNMRFITLGIGSTGYGSESYTDFSLVSTIPSTEYTTTNDSATTGTLLSTEPSSGDLLMIFTRLTRFQMASTFNTTLAPTSAYTINEVGCNWSTTTSADNRYGIFSRTTLLSSITVNPKAVIFVKYTLTVRTDCNQVKTSMYHFAGTGAASFPANKTNVRDLPLFTLASTGEPSYLLNNNNSGTYGANYAFHHPLFEDAGNYNTTYSGVALSNPDNTFGPASKRLWWLQFYTSSWSGTGITGGSNPANRFNTFTSTTTANRNNPPDRMDMGTSPSCVNWGAAYTISSINYGSGVFDTAVAQNLNLFTDSRSAGRKCAESEDLFVSSNVWTRRLRFLFTPSQLLSNITVFKLYRCTLGDWNNNSGQWNCGGGGSTVQRQTALYMDPAATHSSGIVTALSAAYTVSTGHFVGVEYSFTFSRS